ncbi:unnamed protein product [Hymenolepis diminuta]|uniref:Uncharacterized protein n=1 Tax=Hymenolepis diminuta TaxID=6216 RepID=A0A564YJS6_HYMDI|nr:unnamed protein product [Hymenolepis diminuta]
MLSQSILPTRHQKTTLTTYLNELPLVASNSPEKRVQQLISQAKRGDRTLFRLIRHMRSFLLKIEVDDAIMRQLWMKCPSVNMATCLAVNVNKNNLDELAESADKIQELSDWLYSHVVRNITPSHITNNRLMP